MSEDKVGLASVGLGWWGGVLAKGVAATDRGEVVACFARTPESRDSFAEANDCRAMASYDDVLAADDVQGVLLATSHSSHAELIVAAAEAGKHVFVEKPFTLTVAEGKRAIEACEKAGVILQVGHNRRRQAANRRLKALIDGGDLGDVIMVETQQSMPNALKFGDQIWRNDREQSPLGGMTSLGVHMIDTMHYLLGPMRRVFAFSNRMLEAPLIDHATSVVIEFESGQQGYLGTAFVVPPTVNVVVRGTGGTAWNEEDGTKMYRQLPDTGITREAEAIEPNDTIADQLAAFARSISSGDAPETGGAEGLEVVAAMQAMVASVESGCAESVADHR
ncbi:MAG: Gfo/Idh/MocA family protein [Acidimicrobiales bacterium]